jgi:signal transduction histidine kinase
LVVSGFGVLLTALSLWNFARELGEVTTVLGPVLAASMNTALSLAIVYAGYRLSRSELSPHRRWTVAGGCLFGALAAASVQGYTIWIRSLEGRTVAEPLFPLIVFAATGAASGAIIGRLYESVRGERERAAEALDAVSFANSMLRHDVLNGLQIVRGHAELVEAAGESERVTESGHALNKEVDSLEELLENVRSVSNVLLGQAEMGPVDLTALLESAVDTARDTHSGATFETDMPDSLTVEGTQALKPVFTNLLNNAVQHTPPGVRVEVSTRRTDDTVTVTVADDGPGIPPGQRDSIFERGTTADDGNGGLGLHIVDTILERSGGSVRSSDSDLGGAAFVVELPAADPDPQATGEDDQNPLPSDSQCGLQ